MAKRKRKSTATESSPPTGNEALKKALSLLSKKSTNPTTMQKSTEEPISNHELAKKKTAPLPDLSLNSEEEDVMEMDQNTDAVFPAADAFHVSDEISELEISCNLESDESTTENPLEENISNESENASEEAERDELRSLWDRIANHLKTNPSVEVACDKCDHSFQSQNRSSKLQSMFTHARRHLDRVPYGCVICGEECWNIYAHYHTRHSGCAVPDRFEVRSNVVKPFTKIISDCYPELIPPVETHKESVGIPSQQDVGKKRCYDKRGGSQSEAKRIKTGPNQNNDEQSSATEVQLEGQALIDAKSLVQRFKLCQKRIYVELRKSHSPDEKIKCGMCQQEVSRFENRFKHIFVHLSSKPWSCNECGIALRSIVNHWRKKHPEGREKKIFTELADIRPEVAEEAYTLLFKCIPGFDWIKDLSEEELFRCAPRVRSIGGRPQKEHRDKLSGEELEESQRLLERYSLCLRLIHRSFPEGEEEEDKVKCGKCEVEISRANIGPIQAHIATHLKTQPWRCEACDEPIQRTYQHWNKVHPDQLGSVSASERAHLRPEVAADLFELLFECFPANDWIKELNTEELRQRVQSLNSTSSSSSRSKNMTEIRAPLTGEDLEQAQALLDRYAMSLRVIQRELSSIEDKDKIECGSCNAELSKASNIQRHFLTHLSLEPWRCNECDETIRVPYDHWKKSHSEDFTTVDANERAFLRPELATDFYELLFKCLPGFDWVKERSNDELRLFCQSFLNKNSYAVLPKLTGETLEKAEALLDRYSLSWRFIQRKVSSGEGKDTTKCGKCDSTISRTSGMQSHLFVHLSSEPWRCNECDEPISRPMGHWKKFHPEKLDSIEARERAHLRPEIASELYDRLFECLPSFEYVRELDTEEMERDLEFRSSKNETREKLEGEALIEGQRLAQRITLTTKVILAKIQAASSERKFSCGFCSREIGRADMMSQHMWSHLPCLPWRCTACDKPAAERWGHWKRYHENSINETPFSKRFEFRPELAEEAYELLFRCLPGYDWLKEKEMSEIEGMLLDRSVRVSVLKTEHRDELTGTELSDAKKVITIFELGRKIIQKELRQRKNQEEVITCKYCDQQLADPTSLISSHILTHLPCEPWRCLACECVIQNPGHHWARSHPDEIGTVTVNQRAELRPEIAQDAFELLFKCTEGFEWMRKKEMSELEDLSARSSVVKTEHRDQLTGTELSDAKKVLTNFELGRKIIQKELRQRKNQEEVITCKYCDQQLADPSSLISSHILTHLPCEPWRCSACECVIQNPGHHWARSHPDEIGNVPMVQRAELRPEIAQDAYELLFKCNEGFEWMKEMTPLELERHLASYRSIREDEENQPILSPEEMEEKKKLAKRFHLLTRAVGNVLKLRAVHQHKDIECGRCPHQFSSKLSGIHQSAIQHAMSHMPRKSYKCNLCGELTNSIDNHSLSWHADAGIDDLGEGLIRPEVADDAISNLFLCYPDLEWLRESTEKRIAELGDDKFFDFNDSIAEETEPTTSVDLSFRFKKLISAVINQLRNQMGVTPSEIHCEVCQSNVQRPKSKRLQHFIWAHLLSHLDRRAFRCPECQLLTSSLYSHFSGSHKDLGSRSEEMCRDVREEVAPKAIELLFKCYPQFKWLEETDPENLDRLAFTRSLRPDDFTQQFTSEELAKKRNDAIRHYYLAEAIVNKISEEYGQAEGHTIQCGKCQFASFGKFRTRSEIWTHLVHHLDVKPFMCRLCAQTSTNLPSHYHDHHKEDGVTYAEQRIVRPEISDAAIRNLFECFPDYEYLTECSQDELARLAFHKSFQPVNSWEEVAIKQEMMDSGEVIDNESDPRKLTPSFHLQLVQAIINQLRIAHGTSKNSFVPCAACPGFKSKGHFTLAFWNHHVIHAKIKLFLCPTCNRTTSRLSSHMKHNHPDQKLTCEEKRTIRPDAVPVSIATLFDCFPHMKWIYDAEPQEFERLASVRLLSMEDSSADSDYEPIDQTGISIKSETLDTTSINPTVSPEHYRLLALAVIRLLKPNDWKVTLETNIACGKCIPGAPNKPSEIFRHSLSHLSRKAFRCKECSVLTAELYRHQREFHPDSYLSVVEKQTIRSSVAAEATDILFQCFPKFEWLREKTDGELEEIAETGRAQETDEEYDESLPIQFRAIALAAISQKRKEAKENGVQIICDKCSADLSTYRPGSLWAHVIGHLSRRAFSCPECSAFTSSLFSHFKGNHPGVKTTWEQRYTIRPAVAEEAHQVLFECFPGLEWLREKELPELEEMTKTAAK